MFEPFTNDIQHAIELNACKITRNGGKERLAKRWHRESSSSTDRFGEHRHITPSKNHQALFDCDPLDLGLRGGGNHAILWQEPDSGRILADLRKFEVDDLAQEPIRDLQQDPCAIPDIGIGAGSSSMLERAQRPKPTNDNVMTLAAVDVADKVQSTRVMFIGRVVKALPRGQSV